MIEFLFYDLFEHLLFFFEAFLSLTDFEEVLRPHEYCINKARIFQTNCFSSEKLSSTISILH